MRQSNGRGIAKPNRRLRSALDDEFDESFFIECEYHESSVVGSCIRSTQTDRIDIDRVCDETSLCKIHFRNEDLGQVFDLVCSLHKSRSLYRDGMDPEVINRILYDEIRRSGISPDGRAATVNAVQTSFERNAVSHANKVQEFYDLRYLRDESLRIANDCIRFANTPSQAFSRTASLRRYIDGSSSSLQSQLVPNKLSPIAFADLIEVHHSLREPVIENLLRRGETANIIASPKVGKSFLAGNLAWSIADGRPWLS